MCGCRWCEFGDVIDAGFAALASRPALVARCEAAEAKYTEMSKRYEDALDSQEYALTARSEAAEGRVARLEAVLRWFVSEFPCPEIHASVSNRPGRCPEVSDDPNEYCASARFQKALAGPEEG